MITSKQIITGAISWNKGMYDCVKQSVSACLVLKDGTKIYGRNSQLCEQDTCPRIMLNTSSYEACDTHCNQVAHAERDALHKALTLGMDTNGSTMYLTGHWVCCDDCRKAMSSLGVSTAIMVSPSDKIINSVIFDSTDLGAMAKDYSEALEDYLK